MLTLENHVGRFVDHEAIEVHGIHENLFGTKLDGSIPPRTNRHWQNDHEHETVSCKHLVENKKNYSS